MSKLRHPRPKSKFYAYENRNSVLKRLGFDNYKSYLASPLWSSIRRRVLDRDNGKCRLCRKPAVSVHHTRYSIHELNGHTLKRLIAICGGCHQRLEFEDKQKNTLRDANKKYSHHHFLQMQYAIEHKVNYDNLSNESGYWPHLKSG